MFDYQRVVMIGRNGAMNGFMNGSIIVETNWMGYIAIEMVINIHYRWEISKKGCIAAKTGKTNRMGSLILQTPR